MGDLSAWCSQSSSGFFESRIRSVSSRTMSVSSTAFSSSLKTTGVKFALASAASASTAHCPFSKHTWGVSQQQAVLTVLSETLAEVEPAEYGKDSHEDQDDEGRDGNAGEEYPVDERPAVDLRVEHDGPAGDINKGDSQEARHKDFLLLPHGIPAL